MRLWSFFLHPKDVLLGPASDIITKTPGSSRIWLVDWQNNSVIMCKAKIDKNRKVFFVHIHGLLFSTLTIKNWWFLILFYLKYCLELPNCDVFCVHSKWSFKQTFEKFISFDVVLGKCSQWSWNRANCQWCFSSVFQEWQVHLLCAAERICPLFLVTGK